MLCGHVPRLALICLSIFIFQTGEEEGLVSKAVAPSLDYMDFKPLKNYIRDIMEDNFRFNLSSSSDVMVFLHIQKTGDHIREAP